MELENKADTINTSAPEIKQAFDDFLYAFESFKSANDQRLSELEKRSADVLTEDKVNRINAAIDDQKKRLDQMFLDQARPELSVGQKAADLRGREHKAAFDSYIRKGDTSGLSRMEWKSTTSMDATTDANGGYTVPVEIEKNIDRLMKNVSPMRSICSVRQIGGNTYRKPIATTEAAAGWVAETDSRTQTDTPTLKAIDFTTMELYAMPAATQSLLEDSQVDIESWLADEVRDVFAEMEGDAFINGDGDTEPAGLLSATMVANASWVWGDLGYIASGADGAFTTTNPTDTLVTLAYAPKQAYRANGTWLMNRSTEAVVRKFKDDNNNYIWQPGAMAGQPSTLLGYPVAEADDMPDIASDSYAIAFGDFARGYLIVDRAGIQVLRDPYSAKPYVLFYTTKRVGGGIQNYEAIKLMKFAES